MINPIEIVGNWTQGYVLDKHVISSVHIGQNQFGHDQYDTTRSELGELVYKMKYNGHQDTSEEIIELIQPFLDQWLGDKNIDCVIPVPPTEKRNMQPVFLIAEKIASTYGIGYVEDVLVKNSLTASKNMARYNKSVSGTIEAIKTAKKHHDILLVDDLYSTGTTAKECVKVLRDDPNIGNIYFLAMTKTK